MSNNRSFFYQNSLLYKLGLLITHKGDFFARYKYMSDFVRKEDVILEPGCGPAFFADYLPQNTHYYGFDKNESFIKYGLKRGLQVWKGDALDRKNYRSADVVVVCDVLHHLKPKDRIFFLKHCFRSAKRTLVICEEGRSGMQTGGFFYLLSRLWFEYIERDGINKPLLDQVWTADELRSQIVDGFGVVPKRINRQIENIGHELIVAYHKK